MYESAIRIERPRVLNLLNPARRLAERLGLRHFELNAGRILDKAPVFIIGMPRSGTTILQGL